MGMLLDLFRNKWPYTDFHELNADWIISTVRQLIETMDSFIENESISFADPITWNITTQYAKATVVIDASGNAYLSKQAVPSGIQLNSEYWQEIFNFTTYTRTANRNLTFNVETNTTRATAAYSVDDWLILNDILYRVTQPIAIDDTFIIAPAAESNIVHFTVEDFIKAFITYATNLINQYKNDIDASELAYQSAMQAEVDRILAGATVDSEVIEARLGANGINYTTLGNAIRSQFETILQWNFGSQTILANDDLNDFVDKKVYVKAPSTTPVSNLPPFINANTAFTLYVTRNALDNSATNFMQIVIPNRDDHIYIRNHNADGFTDWLPVINSDDRFNGNFAKTISANDDLNNLVAKSCYVKAPSTTPVSNLPPFITASTGFFMMVLRNTFDPTATNFMQIVIPNRDDHIYIRNHDADGFTDWLPLINSDDRYNSAFSTILNAGDDVDTIMSTGIYEASSASSNSILHIPHTGGFTMIEMFGNSAHNTLMQYIFYGGNGYSFIRFYNSTTWSEWVQITGNVDIPQYWEDTIANKNTSIDNNCALHGDKNDSFLFITDVHSPYVYPIFYKLLKYVIDHTPITKIFNGGDSLQDASDSVVISNYKTILNNLSFEDNVMSVRGNHDTSHSSWFYGIMLGRLKDSVDMGGSLDYVYDVISQKIRYIFVDCNDPNNSAITSAQQTWLSDKITELPAGWTVLIITHGLWRSNGTATPTQLANYTVFQNVIDNIYDTCNAQIIGVLSGHAHLDYYETTTKGYLLISRTTPSYAQASTDPNNPTRTKGTTEEISFDGVILDTVSGIIKFIRVGVGNDAMLPYNLKS